MPPVLIPPAAAETPPELVPPELAPLIPPEPAPPGPPELAPLRPLKPDPLAPPELFPAEAPPVDADCPAAAPPDPRFELSLLDGSLQLIKKRQQAAALRSKRRVLGRRPGEEGGWGGKGMGSGSLA